MASQLGGAPWMNASKPSSPVWLRVPCAADTALVVIGVFLLLTGREVGWWVLIFAGVRAVIGTVALVVLAPRIIARRSGETRELFAVNESQVAFRLRAVGGASLGLSDAYPRS